MGSAQTQSQLWRRHPETWSATLETQMLPLHSTTMAALEPLDGLSLLDAGCGSRAGTTGGRRAGAEVTGLDATAELLEIAHRQTPDARLDVGDIDSLPYNGDTFDVVTAFNSIQYAVDPATAVAELARVCRPGGRVAIGIWGDPSRCETESLFQRLRSLAPPPPGTPAPLACSDPGVIEDLLTKAGLHVDGGADVPISFTFDTLDDAWTAHTSAGPLQKVIDTAGPDAVRTVINSVLEADRKPDGKLRQDNIFRYVTATKP